MNIVHYPADKTGEPLARPKSRHHAATQKRLGHLRHLYGLAQVGPLGYRSSYSHGGTYYTLDSIAQYDELGLWSYRDIHFSRHGTLLNTAEALVTQSPAGYQCPNWKRWFTLRPRMPCGSWCKPGGSSAGSGRAVICIVPWIARGGRSNGPHGRPSKRPGDDLQAAKALFYSLLDEQQRRLYAGLESLQCGHGGQQRTAQRFGLDVDTVARGERELLSGQVLRERVRQPGGGRPAVEKKRPKS